MSLVVSCLCGCFVYFCDSGIFVCGGLVSHCSDLSLCGGLGNDFASLCWFCISLW